jgi:hypothetical protein
LAHLPGPRALLPPLAPARQPCNVRDHRHLAVLRGYAVHSRDGRRMPPKEIHKEGRFDPTLIGGHLSGFYALTKLRHKGDGVADILTIRPQAGGRMDHRRLLLPSDTGLRERLWREVW